MNPIRRAAVGASITALVLSAIACGKGQEPVPEPEKKPAYVEWTAPVTPPPVPTPPAPQYLEHVVNEGDTMEQIAVWSRYRQTGKFLEDPLARDKEMETVCTLNGFYTPAEMLAMRRAGEAIPDDRNCHRLAIDQVLKLPMYE